MLIRKHKHQLRPNRSLNASNSNKITTNHSTFSQMSSSLVSSLVLATSILLAATARISQQQATSIIATSTPTTTAAATTTNDHATTNQTCNYPGSPAHASVTFNTSHIVAGTAASYTCDNGYELLGPPRRFCQANGTWAPVGIPFCVLNVGLGKAAMQSSTAGHGSAQKAVDGSTSPYFQASTCTMTDVESNPWWYVNLLEPYLVQIVRIDFGQACCANRQKATIAVRVGNNRPDLGNNPLCNRYHGFIEEGKPLFLPCTRPAPGAFVSIHLESPTGSSLSICETFIYTDHALSIEQCPSFRDQPLGSTATYNGKCYLFHNNQALTFDSARKYCESRGGTLVDETSPALQGFLSWELYRRHRNDQLMGQYWLGATRDARNAQNWKWINGKDVQISFWNTLASQGNCSRFDGSKGWLWSDTDCNSQLNFICQYRPLTCGKPEKPTNSTLITKNIDNGTVIEYQCAPGSVLMGPKSRACLPTGFFSEFAPKCKHVDCQYPAMIPNGDYKLHNGTTTYSSIVTYSCNVGYQIYGRATLTCDVDERWNGPPPRCEPMLCPAPVPPSNGYVTVTSNITTPGVQVTYDCRPGYELVGDRLLTCLHTGSWDNSFPYCREKRSPQLIGSLPQPVAPVAAATPAPRQQLARLPPTSPNVNQPIMGNNNNNNNKPTNGVGGVQFPSPSGAPVIHFSSNRLQTTVASTPLANNNQQSAFMSSSTPMPASSSSSSSAATSLPASLNGMAHQFVHQQQTVSSPLPPILSTSQQTVLDNQVLTSETRDRAKPALVQHPAINQDQEQQSAAASASVTQQPTRFSSSRPQSPSFQSSTGGYTMNPLVTTASGSSPTTLINRQPSSSSTTTTTTTTAAATVGNPKFQLVSQSQSPSPTSSSSSSGSHVSYDSTPLAATNSISVQSSQPSGVMASMGSLSNPASTSPSISSIFSNSPSSSLSTPSSSSSSSSSSPNHFRTTTTTANIVQQQNLNLNPNQQQQQKNFSTHNVLASFSPPVRSHNTLASAKYSLDGIIAVAIFGGFIFLGAIITIIVIIIRRKSGRSSTIDAQTISTYDSNGAGGEHNGLYRNYQQAWENLRFATPSSQPKLSGHQDLGGGGVGAGASAAAVLQGSALGLKNFAPSIHHHNHHGIHHASLLHGGHHNLAMTSETSTSGSDSSSLGAGAGVGINGDPLLASHHHHHNHSHHDAIRRRSMVQQQQQQQQQQQHQQQDDEDDYGDEDEDGEQGILSSDEANYLHRTNVDGGINGGEGFRDTNELTINADTALVVNGRPGQSTARRRIYSTNSIGRGQAAAAAALNQHNHHHLHHNLQNNRLSTGNISSSHHLGNHNHHQHHHHHHHQPGGGSGGSGGSGGGGGSSGNSSQHQRLVSSSTPSESTRSSRASPPSGDDQSLDRLAYGVNAGGWRPNNGTANS